MSQATRRTALALVAALPAAAVPALALPVAPDPIFSAIETRKAAQVYWSTIEDEGPEYDAAGHAEANAARAMVKTVPTSVVGVLALLRYVIDCEDQGDEIANLYMDPDDQREMADKVLLRTLATALERIIAAA